MIYTTTALKPRGTDSMGSGDYKATRGAQRQHKGVDLLAEPGIPILAPVRGEVTKIGYPYGLGEEENKNSYDIVYRYVQITDLNKRDHRFFYVAPAVALGDVVFPNQCIGIAQNINARISMDGRTYGARGMGNHVHVEIRDVEGDFIDPATVYA